MAQSRLSDVAKVDERPYSPHTPTTKQQEFLDATEFEVLYGGAAGGGKSDAALMDALRYVEHSNYRAMIFRRTYPQLAGVGGLIERSKEWLSGRARWLGQRSTWTFPSGAVIGFGHMQHEDDKYNLQSLELHRVYFEEATQFTKTQYEYALSRVRKGADDPIPLAARLTANPGGVGHEWVKNKFINWSGEGRRFIPSTLRDNPHIDQEQYLKSLSQLDPITRAQLERGDWDAVLEGNFFKRHWFEIVESIPIREDKQTQWLRFWDLAATEAKPGTDPDYTAGALVGLYDGRWTVKDMQRFRAGPQEVEERIKQQAKIDGLGVAIRMEQEPGSSGKAMIDYYARKVLTGYSFKGVRSTGNKVERAKPVSAAANNGLVRMVRAQWNDELLDEFVGFPLGVHDDMVDAVSGALAELTHNVTGKVSTSKRGRTKAWKKHV